VHLGGCQAAVETYFLVREDQKHEKDVYNNVLLISGWRKKIKSEEGRYGAETAEMQVEEEAKSAREQKKNSKTENKKRNVWNFLLFNYVKGTIFL
jgi:hypothetical protein